MSELLQKLPDNDSKTSPVAGLIAEGDRNNRFWLSLQDGSTTLNIADDIAKKCVFANNANKVKEVIDQIQQAIEQFPESQEILLEELKQTEILITDWLEKHKDHIILEKTGFVGTPVKTYNEIVRYQFLITQKSSDVFLDEDLDNELTALEEQILKEIKPKTIRIDTILLPDINADLSNIDA
jgi:hypothetical protein